MAYSRQLDKTFNWSEAISQKVILTKRSNNSVVQREVGNIEDDVQNMSLLSILHIGVSN